MKRVRLSLTLAILLAGCGGSPAEKVRVLLDTDTFNEMDDQFFVTYALLEPKFEVEGICATQYRVTEGSVDESYYEARRILDLMGKTGEISLYMGSDVALPDPKSPRTSPASRFIVSRAMAEDPRPLYVLAVGALTNVASAYLENPQIRDRIRLIWLGGSRWPEGALDEFNAINDPAAVKCIVEAGMDFTQIPTETCARQLTTTFREAEKRLKHRGSIADFLVDLYRDYGQDQKVIWDMTAVACLLQQTGGERFFEIEDVRSPRVDQSSLEYIPDPEGAPMKVCTRLERDKIFEDFYSRFPAAIDYDPPYLILATSRGDMRTVTLTFNEDLEPASSLQAENYTLQPEIAVISVSAPDPRSVRLALGRDLDPSVTYTITCRGIRDDSPRRNEIQWRAGTTFRPEPALRDGLLASVIADPGPSFPMPEYSALKSTDVRRQILDTWLTPTRDNFIPDGLKKSGFVLLMEGFLEAPLKHEYEISCYVDDAVRIELGGRVLFEADTRIGTSRAMARVRLEKGRHPLRIFFRQRRGSYLLNLYWNFPFHEKQRIPADYFCHPV